MVEVVRGHDSLSGLMLQLAGTWGVDPASWDANGLRVPLLSETITVDQATLPESQEYGNLGGLESLDLGRRTISGQIQVEPRYESPWFIGCLLAQIFGYEDFEADKWHDESAAIGVNSHLFNFNAALGEGLAANIFKAGPGPITSGYVETVLGLLVTRMVWEQPEGDRPRVTFDLLGKSVSVDIGVANVLNAVPSANAVKYRDLERTESMLFFGATMQALNVSGFRLTVDRKIQPSAAFLNDPDVLTKPGVEGTREITLEITSQLEQDYGAAFKPTTEFLANTLSQAHIVYASETDIIADKPYVIRFDLPEMRWTSIGNALSDPGVAPTTFTARATVGTIAGLSSGKDDYTSIPSGGSTDLRCTICTDIAADSDAKYTSFGDS